MSKMSVRIVYTKAEVEEILREAARGEGQVVGGSAAVWWDDEGDNVVVEFSRCPANKVERERDLGPPADAVLAELVA